MGLTHSPSIVKSGLALHLDAVNIKSYPGTGTTWYNISGGSNHATMNNGVTFADQAMTFDGVDDYAALSLPAAATYTAVTIEGFIKWNSANSGMFLGFSGYDVWTANGCLGYNNGQSNVVGINAATVTSLGLIGRYHHYAFVMNRSGLMSLNKIYINGVPMTISAVVAADGNAPGLSTTLRLASWNNGGYHGNVSYGNVRIYGRELSPSEIQKNFAATRGRYGV